jgi:hypothetical protein
VLFATIVFVFMNPAGMRLGFGTPLSARTFFAATLGGWTTVGWTSA